MQIINRVRACSFDCQIETELSQWLVHGGTFSIFYSVLLCVLLFLFCDNKIKMTRTPEMKQKENLVRCTGEGKRLKGNIREGKTGTVMELSLKVR